MASFLDVELPKNMKASVAWKRVQCLLGGSISIEVLPVRNKRTVILRLWTWHWLFADESDANFGLPTAFLS
jgi:hypothetical protein